MAEKLKDGIICPQCGADTKIVDTRRLTGVLVRTRACGGDCNRPVWVTEERITGMVVPKRDEPIVLPDQPPKLPA